MGDMISFACPGGNKAEGYEARAKTPKGAVVVIQEWWGLNAQIKRTTDRFAAAGYSALAPDLYKGRVTQAPDEAKHLYAGLDFLGATQIELAGAVAHLKKNADKVAVLGYCMGGTLAILAGIKVKDCAAAIAYYGIPGKELADPALMAAPFQGHYGETDASYPPERVAELEAAVKKAGVPSEVYLYPAGHAFFNEESAAYHKPSAELAWERTLAFLTTHIG